MVTGMGTVEISSVIKISNCLLVMKLYYMDEVAQQGLGLLAHGTTKIVA